MVQPGSDGKVMSEAHPPGHAMSAMRSSAIRRRESLLETRRIHVLVVLVAALSFVFPTGGLAVGFQADWSTSTSREEIPSPEEQSESEALPD